jgi:hypothetical protein
MIPKKKVIVVHKRFDKEYHLKQLNTKHDGMGIRRHEKDVIGTKISTLEELTDLKVLRDIENFEFIDKEQYTNKKEGQKCINKPNFDADYLEHQCRATCLNISKIIRSVFLFQHLFSLHCLNRSMEIKELIYI